MAVPLLRNALVATANVVFPPYCAACDGRLCERPEKLLLCDRCRELLTRDRGPACRRCAAPMPRARIAGDECPRCRDQKFHLAAVWSLGRYAEEGLRELVLRLKRPGSEPLATALGRLAVEQWLATVDLPEFDPREIDAILPVPMHWWRRLRRGMNSPELVAEQFARRLGKPVLRNTLRRCRHTAPQAGLSAPQRHLNVRNAFTSRREYQLEGQRLLLIDDILTTGATANEAARMLLKAGAASVRAVVLARAVGS